MDRTALVRRCRCRRARAHLAASALVLVHVVDESLVRVPDGAAGSSRAWGAAVTAGLLVLGAAAFVTGPGWARALLSALPGTVATAHGATHAVGVVGPQRGGADVTGLLMLLGGVALLLLAAAELVRPTSTPRARRSWARRAATVLTAAVVTVVVLLPVALGTVQVNLPRGPTAPAPTDDFAEVGLRTEDGVRLAAWYRPSRNGAAVVLLSSARGEHGAVDAHAELLAGRGFGVLVYDARGSGTSGGTANGWGWTWPADVAAALDFVVARPDVTGGVGLLGLSTGADVALEVAATDPRVDAVVADGATAQGFADRPPGLWSAVSLWPMYATARALTGVGALPPLTEAVAALAPRPVLLVAAGSIPQEIPLNQRYARAGGASVDLWELPETAHTRALDEHPVEYDQRVLGFFDEALVAPSSDG